MSAPVPLKQWVKHSPHPMARLGRTLHKARHHLEIPKVLCTLYRPLWSLHHLVRNAMAQLVQTFYWTPLFKSRLTGTARALHLYGGLPFISGPLQITCLDHCRLSGATTLSARSTGSIRPHLYLGNNVGIGWQTTIAVGTEVILKDNVRLGGRNFLAGYPGHPLDAKARAAGLPDLDEQAGPILLEEDVWLGTGVMVMAGVTIGPGTIIAAGSVVTKSLPGGVLAGGNPARILRSLEQKDPQEIKQEAAE